MRGRARKSPFDVSPFRARLEGTDRRSRRGGGVPTIRHTPSRGMRSGAVCPGPSLTAPISAACSWTQLRPTRRTSAASATVSSGGSASSPAIIPIARSVLAGRWPVGGQRLLLDGSRSVSARRRVESCVRYFVDPENDPSAALLFVLMCAGLGRSDELDQAGHLHERPRQAVSRRGVLPP
jgi:hypothetical protein